MQPLVGDLLRNLRRTKSVSTRLEGGKLVFGKRKRNAYLLAGELLEQAAQLVRELLVLRTVLGRVDVVASLLADLLLGGIEGCTMSALSLAGYACVRGRLLLAYPCQDSPRSGQGQQREQQREQRQAQGQQPEPRERRSGRRERTFLLQKSRFLMTGTRKSRIGRAVFVGWNNI